MKLRLRLTLRRHASTAANHLQRAASHLDQANKAFDRLWKSAPQDMQQGVAEFDDGARKLSVETDALRDELMVWRRKRGF